ncbi:MAG TPA: CHRD domain-containing protein [Longimicrobium sp.]|nr:CHRD domain-containing protein [Longimicrobium sp.]
MIRKLVMVAALAGAAACNSDDEERFEATLTGSGEVPPVSTTSTGSAFFTVNDDNLEFNVGAQNITGAIAAHIHSGAPGVNGPPLVFLFQAAPPGVSVTAGSLNSGTVDQTDMIAGTGVSYDSMVALIRNGNAYVNIHTVARPAGEVRGQIVRP